MEKGKQILKDSIRIIAFSLIILLAIFNFLIAISDWQGAKMQERQKLIERGEAWTNKKNYP